MGAPAQEGELRAQLSRACGYLYSVMWGLTKRAGLVLLPVVLLITMALAPNAIAAKKVITKSKTVGLVGTNVVRSAVAKCPRTMLAVGGGFSSTPQLFAAPPNLPNFFESQRAGERGWRVTAGQTATNGSGKITAFVYCRKQNAPIKEISASEPLSTLARSQNTALATCPKGTKAIAGGFELPAPEGIATVFPTDSEKSGGRGWTVTGVRDSDPASQTGSVDAIAYCVRNATAKTKLRSTQYRTNDKQDVVPVAVTPTCKAPTLVSSGGFNAPFAQRGSERGATLVTESRRKGNAWQVSGYGLGPSNIDLSLTAFAYCR